MSSHWWVTDLLDQPVILVSWIVWVIGSISLHELGHGVAALHQGDRTPRESGHMTINPVVHMGVPSLVMFAIVGIAWGAMPVDPSRFRSRFGDAVVSAAGPMVNLALAAVTIAAGGALLAFPGALGDPLHENLATFFRLGAMLNLVLAALNLLPIPPLDGSRILSSFFPRLRLMPRTEQGWAVSMIAVVLVFSFAGGEVFAAARDAVDPSLEWVRGVVRLAFGGGGE